MKKVLIASFVLAAFLGVALLAHAQSVYPVPGSKDMFKASITVKNYEPYPSPKEDGKVGKLYGWVGGVDKTAEAKKYYIMKTSKISKKDGAAATLSDLKEGTVIMTTYKKVESKKKGEDADLEVTEMVIQ
jgi:hypothetical protein